MEVNKIIIEGCDGTGKTTLCKQLAEKYGLDVVHVTSKDPNDFDFYRQTLRKTNVIYDRHFVGELVYPLVYNRAGKLNINDAKWLRTECVMNNVKILILTADFEEVKRRLLERGEEDFVFEKIEHIYRSFESLAEMLGIKTFDTSEEDAFEFICEYLESGREW